MYYIITYKYIKLAPKCFDVNTSSSGSFLFLTKITYIMLVVIKLLST